MSRSVCVNSMIPQGVSNAPEAPVVMQVKAALICEIAPAEGSTRALGFQSERLHPNRYLAPHYRHEFAFEVTIVGPNHRIIPRPDCCGSLATPTILSRLLLVVEFFLVRAEEGLLVRGKFGRLLRHYLC